MHSSKKIVFVIIFISSVFSAGAQIKFQRTYGIGLYNEGRCVRQTFDGGYIIAGSESDAGNGSSDVYLLKIDSLGIFQWNKTFGGSNIDRGYSVEQLSDSGYVVCGYTNSFGNGGYDGYLIRTDKNGDTLWTKTYGGTDWDFLYSMKKTFDGGFVMAGNSYSNNNNSSQSFLVKTDSSGDLQWTKSIELDDEVFINALSVLTGGDYVITGYQIDHVNGDENTFTAKTNLNGDTLWTKITGDVDADENANAIDVNPIDGSIVIAGYSKNLISGNFDSYFTKLNQDGSTNFIMQYFLSGEEMINDIHFNIHDSVGFIAAAITTSSSLGNKDFHFMIIDTVGTFIFGPTCGGFQNDIPYHIEKTNDGGYILTGSSTSFRPGIQSLYVIKYDSLFQTSSLVIGIKVPEVSSKYIFNYPNPFHEFTTFDLQNFIPAGKFNLSIYNVLGEEIISNQITENGKLIFYRNNIPNGIYFYKLTDKQKIIGYGKIIVD